MEKNHRIIRTDYYENLKNILSDIAYEPETIKIKNDYYRFIPMGLDIETTQTYQRDDKGKITEHFSFMYIWQWSVWDYTFLGRTYEELLNFINSIFSLVLKSRFKTICFIHNESFEFSFLAKFLQQYYNLTVFARKKRHPIKFELNNQLLFLDSYLLTGFSLEKLAEIYTNIRKLVGDLDYKLIRTSETPMKNDEVKYCVNDVQILSAYAVYYRDNYLHNNFLPLTKTMIAGKVVKNMIKKMGVQKEVYFLMKNQYPKSKQEYEYIMSFFFGAYTHGMLYNLFETIRDVLKFDVDSEYPYSFMLPEYPISKFRKLSLKNVSRETLENVINNYACLIDVTFKNIKTTTGVTIISKNNVSWQSSDCMWDNGRLYSGSVRIRITNLDYISFSMHYNITFDNSLFNDISFAKKGYLPKYFRLAIASLYNDKTELKGIQGKEIEYIERKKSLNGQYGSCVCRLQFTELDFLDGWQEMDKDVNFDRIWMNKVNLPQWGVFCTANARFIILSAIKQMQKGGSIIKDYIYSDTDSIACKNTKFNLCVFQKINAARMEYNKKWVNDLGLSELFPKTNFLKMGTFDNETYNKKDGKIEALKRFKTLGAKRYIVEKNDGMIETTVAGMRKKAFLNYCEKNDLEPFSAFVDGLSLDFDNADKMTTYYCDDVVTKNVTDYLGNTTEVISYGYVTLAPTSFNITISDELKQLYFEIK